MAFSYDHHDSSFSLTADNVFLSRMPTHMPLLPQQVGEMTNSPSCFFYYTPAEISAAETGAFDSSCSLGTTSTGVQTPSVSSHAGHTPVLMAKHHTEISSVQHENSFDRSKSEAQTSLTDKQCKDAKQNKNKKQKRSCGGDVKQKLEKKLKNDESKACKEDASPEYIHVRARRGQATDSHSLAERVRREKISERMKMLQGLVPGCDKVTGKAHMLDEIINYVQSLQNQVEFLSMKLASFSPVLYDFGLELDECMNQPDHQKMFSNMSQTVTAENINHLNSRVIEGEAVGYNMVDLSAPLLLQGQVSTTLSQDVGSFVVQLAAQRQGLLNQLEIINMCTFQ